MSQSIALPFPPPPPAHADMQLLERLAAPTPKFFRRLRTIGLCLTGVAGVLLTSPISLPALVVGIAGYLGVAGAVMTTVSQTAVPGES